MMGDAQTTSVYLRGEDGKPYEAAQFANFEDAQDFANTKHKFGEEVLVVQGEPGKEQLAAKFPEPEQRVPANSALDARIAAAKAQLLDEQMGEAAKKQAQEELDEAEDGESVEDAIAARKAASKKAQEEEAAAAEEAEKVKAINEKGSGAAPAEDEAGPSPKATSSKSKET
jgi:hypothetical protein